MTMQQQQRVVALAGYGAGSFGANLALWPVLTMLLYFLTETVGFSVALATVVITAPKVWDICIDPLIGAWADRAAVRTGHRGRLMFLAAGLMPAAIVLVFMLPSQAPSWVAVIAIVLLILKSSAFMVFFISHVALADDIDRAGTARRDSVLAMRVAGQAMGSLCAGAVGPLLITAGGGGSGGYRLMAFALAVAALVGMGIVALTARRFSISQSTAPAPAKSNLLAAIRAAFHNRTAGALILSNFVLYLATAFVSTFMPYMNKLLLGASDSAMAMLYSSLMVAMLCGSALAAAFTRRFQRIPVLIAGTLVMLLAALSFYPTSATGAVIAASASLLVWGLGLGMYALLVFSATMDAAKASGAGAGLLLGLLISTGKIGDSLGGVFAGGLLSAIGYRAGSPLSADMMASLRSAYAGAPVIAMLISAGILLTLLRRPAPPTLEAGSP